LVHGNWHDVSQAVRYGLAILSENRQCASAWHL
jgi:hypothetical protein